MKTLSAWVQAPKHRAIAAISLIFILLPAVCLYQAFLSPLKEGICIGGVEAGGTPFSSTLIYNPSIVVDGSV